MAQIQFKILARYGYVALCFFNVIGLSPAFAWPFSSYDPSHLPNLACPGFLAITAESTHYVATPLPGARLSHEDSVTLTSELAKRLKMQSSHGIWIEPGSASVPLAFFDLSDFLAERSRSLSAAVEADREERIPAHVYRGTAKVSAFLAKWRRLLETAAQVKEAEAPAQAARIQFWKKLSAGLWLTAPTLAAGLWFAAPPVALAGGVGTGVAGWARNRARTLERPGHDSGLSLVAAMEAVIADEHDLYERYFSAEYHPPSRFSRDPAYPRMQSYLPVSKKVFIDCLLTHGESGWELVVWRR